MKLIQQHTINKNNVRKYRLIYTTIEINTLNS